MKKIFIMLLITIILFPTVVKGEPNLTASATSSIMIEASSGEIVFEKDKDKRQAVASLTKMMGLILFFEIYEKGGITLDEKITVSENAKNMGGTQIYLETGEKISVRDLIKGITMASANDAMVALAERLAGTEDNFVNMMNEKAEELGLKNTNFKNVTGLDEKDHYSTAYDMAIIARELLKHDGILDFTKVYEDYIRQDTSNKSWIVNTNKLVRFYDGADGLKTGFTDNAGSCIAVTAKRNGLRFIVIALGYKKSTVRNEEAKALLDYGFNLYKVNVLKEKGEVIGRKKLDKAKKEELNLILKEDASVMEKKTDGEKQYKFEIKIDELKYPIKKDDIIGKLIIKSNGRVVKEVDLTTDIDIDKANIVYLYLKNLKEIILGII
jgi:D-alanyl-D-alanine carboxypeptidase (penicillin-binding protein 5/6)